MSDIDPRLTDALEAHPAIHDWTARRQHGRSVQIYLAGEVVENLREVEREAYEIEVFNDHQVDGELRRGAATVPLSREDLARLPEVLDEAAAIASLVHNPPWPPPVPHEHPEVPLADPALTTMDAALAAARDAADRIRQLAATERGSGVRLSAAELFLTMVEEDLRNSRGLTGTATSTRLLLEIALLARGDADETEFFRQAEARRLDDLAIEQTVVRGSAMARDKLQAGTPRTRLGPVVVSDEALGHLFGGTAVSSTGAFLTQASAQLAYSNISRFELGEPVYGGRPLTGDPLTLRSNARLPHGVASYRFDGDGIAAQDLLVIEDGVLRARPATQRYAHYLGIPATGRVGMVQVAPGSTSSTELLAGDGAVLEVVAFSAPNVDVLTGDFGMEIRLGYEHGPDGRRPVAGGSLTGNLFSAMAGARLSSETHQLATYAGPVAIRFDALQVAGED